MTAKPSAALGEVEALLKDLHGQPVSDVQPLSGGFWSAAYAYSVDDRDFVLRLSDVPEGFLLDSVAHGLAGEHLPVPEILTTGAALGTSYAVSPRHHGQFLEDADGSRSALRQLLAGLRKVPGDPAAPVALHGQGAESFRRWVADSLVDWPDQRTSGWRATLATLPTANAVFVAAERGVAALLDVVPERRDLVHGDLLHSNVLITPDGSEVTGVFSWKCALRGDFLYDTAWCTFWSPWHPGIAAADAWALTTSADDLQPADLADAAARHHCYELAIGAAHLGWYVWTGNSAELARATARLTEIVDRGPLNL